MDISKKDYESYEKQVLLSMKTNKMAQLSDENTLSWIRRKIKDFEDKEELKGKKKNGTPSMLQ